MAAIIIPTVGSVRTSAKKAKTKVQFSQIIQAYELFKQEYGFYPSLYTSTTSTPNIKKLTGATETRLLAGALTGKEPNGAKIEDDDKDNLCGNRKRLGFYSFATDELTNDYKIKDAFGNTEIVIISDKNGDGRITKNGTASEKDVADFEDVTGNDGEIFTKAKLGIPTEGVRASVIIYSAGDKGKGVKSWE